MPQSAPDSPSAIDRPRVVIVDDEPLARDCIRIALQGRADVEIVAECGDGEEAITAIRELAPDIVFLDVQMPELDGFGVIERVGAQAMPSVVFVTAYDQHAVRAFEVHALDYVLKPFDDERLLSAFDHARLMMLDRRHSALGRNLAQMLEGLQQAGVRVPAPVASPAGATDEGEPEVALRREEAGDYVTRFTVRTEGSAHFVPVAAVDWLETEGNYVVLHVGAEAHKVRGTLRDVLARLDPHTFVRIHKTAIVNVERIRELQPWFGGDYVAILSTGAKLKVSRRRVGELLRPMT